MIKTLSLVLGLATASTIVPHEKPVQALAVQERAALTALESLQLAGQTAGAAGDVQILDASSRSALQELQATQQLEDMRAGDLDVSNHDLSTILLVLGIVALIVIIL